MESNGDKMGKGLADKVISIHTLRVESNGEFVYSNYKYGISIHTLRVESN